MMIIGIVTGLEVQLGLINQLFGKVSVSPRPQNIGGNSGNTSEL
jgi:hypothetical protein